MRMIAAGVGLLLISAAHAVDVQMMTPLDFLWLLPGPQPIVPLRMYGPSGTSNGTDATWQVGQWNTNPPFEQMLPFKAVDCEAGQTQCYRAAGSNNIFTQFTSGGTKFVRIQSQGINQPCQPGGTGGILYEQDSLIGPTYGPNYPSYPAGATASAPTLATLLSLTFNFTLNVKYAAWPSLARPVGYTGPNAGYKCDDHDTETVQQTSFLVASTFSNATAGQTLFYQLAVGRLGYVHNNLQSGAFPLAPPSFGYGDDVINVGGNSRIAVQGVPVSYSFNILPRLSFALSVTGASTNLANWRPAGVYIGHYTYGNIGAITEWSNVSYVGVQ